MTGETLTVFLAARLDEDAAEARFVHVIDCSLAFVSPEHCQCDCGTPARVLREVAAKQAILARFGEPPEDADLGEHLQHSQEQAGLRRAVRLLAAVYSDHPDYRAGWAP